MNTKTIKSGTKSFFKGLGEAIALVAEAQAETSRRVAEIETNMAREQLELDILTGNKRVKEVYTLDSFLGGQPTYQVVSTPKLEWDPNNKGHLTSCPAKCRIERHCASCGDRAATGSIYCWSCK